jgi:fumarate reductase subunit D
MTLLDDSTVVTGILYQHKDSTDTQLLSGLEIGVKLFDGLPITGFTYRLERSTEDSLVSGSRVTGVVYRFEDGLDDVILRSARIKGVIFRRRDAGGEVVRDSDTIDSSSAVPSSLEHGLPEGSHIVGLICHQKHKGDEQVVTGSRVKMNILSGSSIVGIVYESPDGENIKRVTGPNITGLLFQEQNAGSETIVGDINILGIIYQDKNALFERFSAGSHETRTMAARVVLYVLLIFGILGLALPIIRKDADFSSLDLLALPSVVITVLLTLMVIIPVLLLVYEKYSSRMQPTL